MSHPLRQFPSGRFVPQSSSALALALLRALAAQILALLDTVDTAESNGLSGRLNGSLPHCWSPPSLARDLALFASKEVSHSLEWGEASDVALEKAERVVALLRQAAGSGRKS